MRPNYVVTATDKNGRIVLYGLYYNERKARRAFKKLESPSGGSYEIPQEEGFYEAISGSPLVLTVKIRYLGEPIGTKQDFFKKSFFNTSEEEFHELAQSYDIPVGLLKEIAGYEKDYIENRRNTRWNARKRAYLPVWLYKWI
jgi:hypothetical protein